MGRLDPVFGTEPFVFDEVPTFRVRALRLKMGVGLSFDGLRRRLNQQAEVSPMRE